jgi:hypothetical protein
LLNTKNTVFNNFSFLFTCSSGETGGIKLILDVEEFEYAYFERGAKVRMFREIHFEYAYFETRAKVSKFREIDLEYTYFDWGPRSGCFAK